MLETKRRIGLMPTLLVLFFLHRAVHSINGFRSERREKIFLEEEDVDD
jgi:hypothetical protein